MRGPILALHWWMRYALAAYPSTPYICKSDDDVFLYLSDIMAHLRSIPTESVAYAYYGAFNFYHVHERRASATTQAKYKFHGYGPTYFWAKYVAKDLKYHRMCNVTADPGLECAGRALCRRIRARAERPRPAARQIDQRTVAHLSCVPHRWRSLPICQRPLLRSGTGRLSPLSGESWRERRA